MALEAWDGVSISHATAVLLAARDDRLGEASGPWSIAELGLTDADFEKLLCWCRQATGEGIKGLVERATRVALPPPRGHELLPGAAVAGLLLLALCAEATARHGSCTGPWPGVVKAIGECPLREALFTLDAPKPLLRDALLAAARECDLRSGDLDDPSIQRWYRLLLLQGGVPRRDVDSIPSWLADPRGGTLLVGALQRDVPAFRTAWDGLERFRRGELSRDRAGHAVVNCAFFRGPVDAILDAACRPLDVRAGTLKTDGEPVAASGVLSASMRLVWEADAAPRVILTPLFCHDDGLGVRVEVAIDGIPRARYRRSAGLLTRFGAGPITVPLASRWALTARGLPDGEVAEADVLLFGEDDDLVCFDATGEPCGVDSRTARFLVARAPLVAVPDRRVVWLEADGVGVAEIEPGVIVSVVEEGVVLWPASGAAHVEAPPLVVEHAEVPEGGDLGALSVRISYPTSVRVKAARVGAAQFAELTSTASGSVTTTTLEGFVRATSVTPMARLTVTATTAGRTFQRTLPFRAFTKASIDGEWLAPTATVEAERLRGGALRVSLGPEYSGYDARVVAGGAATMIDVDSTRSLRIRALGYGEPLVLCGQSPWLEGPRQTLAACVEDHRLVVRHDPHDGRVRITHRLQVDSPTSHWVLVWPRLGAPVAVALSDVTAPADESFVIPYAGVGPPRAVALCYGNAVQGASWADDWSDGLETAGLSTDGLVTMIRLLSLPVLAGKHRDLVVQRLRARGVAEATVALVDAGEEEGRLERRGLRAGAFALRLGGDGDRWPLVARALLLELRLTAEQLGALKRWRDHVLPPAAPPVGVASAEQIAAVRQAAAAARCLYHGLLLSAGSVHPRDAVCVAPHASRERMRLAIGLADLSRGVNVEDLEGADGARKKRLRRQSLAARLRRLPPIDPTTSAAVGRWMSTTEPPGELLQAALVDQRMHQRIQLELLDELAFPRN